MESKIRDIVDGCPYPSPIKCTVGASCGECKTLAILALIAADRAGLVGLLAEAKLQIEYLHDKFKETGSGNAVLGKIDSALKGEGK